MLIQIHVNSCAVVSGKYVQEGRLVYHAWGHIICGIMRCGNEQHGTETVCCCLCNQQSNIRLQNLKRTSPSFYWLSVRTRDDIKYCKRMILLLVLHSA